MSGGDRFATFEQNLLKIYVLLNYRTFGAKQEEVNLLNKIRDNFESDGWKMHLSLFPKHPDIEGINKAILDVNEKANVNLISIVSDLDIELEEGGGGYSLNFESGRRMVYPTMPSNQN